MAQHDVSESLYELGKLYCDRGDFSVALEKLTAAADGFLADKLFPEYLKCINQILRIRAERQELDEIQAIKEKLQDLVIKEGLALGSKTYYTLGLCASYRNQFELALDYLQKALAQSLSDDDKEHVCYSINGLAIVYTRMGKLSEALKEIYNLQVFFQVMELPELELTTKFLNAHILREKGMYEQALEIFWQCYDELRETKNMTYYIYVLTGLGETYQGMGEDNLARMYLNLALRAVDSNNMKNLHMQIESRLDKLGKDEDGAYDLVFDGSSHSVIESKLGRINFKNQFILLDMMRLFLQNPGKVFSKEELVQSIWKQDYDPNVHDNKIYVTIKRLRKLIEPDYDRPKYIFRAKNGYYLNKTARVLVDL